MWCGPPCRRKLIQTCALHPVQRSSLEIKARQRMLQAAMTQKVIPCPQRTKSGQFQGSSRVCSHDKPLEKTQKYAGRGAQRSPTETEEGKDDVGGEDAYVVGFASSSQRGSTIVTIHHSRILVSKVSPACLNHKSTVARAISERLPITQFIQCSMVKCARRWL